jgi:hypothetical protein
LTWTVDKILSLTKEVEGCLEWTRCLNTDGYARIGPNVKVHRLIYELLHGEDISGKVVMHLCDNKKCLNPEHLKVGTFGENNSDRSVKDRSYRVIKSDLVNMVKAFGAETSNAEVARQIGIDPRRVSEIRTGKRGPDGRLIKQHLL